MTMGLNKHLSDTVSTVKVISACQSQSREPVRMMYGMDANRRKWRWWRSAHVQQLTFQRSALQLKYRMLLLQGFQSLSQWHSRLCELVCVWLKITQKVRREEWDTHSLTWVHTCTCSHHAARGQRGRKWWHHLSQCELLGWCDWQVAEPAIYSKGSFNSPAPLCDLQ